MTRRTRRQLVRTGLSGVAFALAGCTSFGLGSDDTRTETVTEDRTSATTMDQPAAETTAERSTDSTRADASSTPAMTPSTPVGTSSAGADLGVHNGDDERHTVRIVVEKDGNAPLFDRETTVPAGESVEWDLPLEAAGTYRITATLDDGTSTTHEWQLDDPSTAAARIVYINIEGGEIDFSNMYV